MRPGRPSPPRGTAAVSKARVEAPVGSAARTQHLSCALATRVGGTFLIRKRAQARSRCLAFRAGATQHRRRARLRLSFYLDNGAG